MSRKKAKKPRTPGKRRRKTTKRTSSDSVRFYAPEIVQVGTIDGLTNETIPSGSSGMIVQKAFLTSLDDRFALLANELLGHFLPKDQTNQLNSVLIRLKNKTEAHIYRNFPLALGIRARGDIANGTVVTDEQIADIRSVNFKDAVANLNPKDGEQFIWLFRSNWVFGLYFDLTSKLKQSEILPHLGSCWKHVNYMSEYQFMSSVECFDRMVEDGWFPFIALRGTKFKSLMTYYKEGCKHKSLIDAVVDSFDEDALGQMTQYWWRNEYFAKKQKMLLDAIEAYKSETYTLSGKALSTELEGILRYAYNFEVALADSSAKQKPNTFHLREYLKSKSQEKHSLSDSLCFPAQFIKYLEKYTFQGFDLANGNVPEGRNTVAHGVTPDNMYTKEFSLKAILALDNARFFLGDAAIRS